MSFSNTQKTSGTSSSTTANSSTQVIKKGEKPDELDIRKIGIVTRDYRKEFPNERRDFNHTFEDVLKLLDDKGCDAVLFSLYSIIPDDENPLRGILSNLKLKNIKAVFIEEFQDGEPRTAIRNVVYYSPTSSDWHEYEFHQVFGQGSQVKKVIDGFKNDEIPKRVMGNCCVLLCGETNGATCADDENRKRTVVDTYKLREAIFDKYNNVNVILNPIHDRMTRYEMKLKRQFLSENGKWVIAVWNKGKKDKNGKIKDGNNPAWQVFFDGKERHAETILNNLDVEIGIVDTNKP